MFIVYSIDNDKVKKQLENVVVKIVDNYVKKITELKQIDKKNILNEIMKTKSNDFVFKVNKNALEISTNKP